MERKSNIWEQIYVFREQIMVYCSRRGCIYEF